jgi:hypothetical protein
VNVTLERSLSVITGQVRSSTAAALAGVTIVATSGDLALSTLSTDPNGGFRLENVTSGWWTVTFTLEGYADTVVLVQVTNADQNLGTVSMRPPAT